MLRNLLVGIGNALREGGLDSEAEREALVVLRIALSDAQPLVRGHAAWALGETAHVSPGASPGPESAIAASDSLDPISAVDSAEPASPMFLLRARQRAESDPYVLEEIERATTAG